MNVFALLGISFLPALLFFVLAVILNKDFKIRWGLFAGALGLLTVVPTSLIQYYVLSLPIFNGYTFASVMVTAVIFNGLIEEAMKMLFMCPIPQKKQNLSAFFCCAILFGLFVGGFESVVYVVRKFQEITLISGKEIVLKLLFGRIFSAQAIHVFCSGLLALYLWNFRNGQKNIMPFVYAVLLHGIYNFFAGFSSGYRWLALAAILFAAVECRIFYLTARDGKKE
ncbi:MAG: PrsW family intramembrane metalloprotease [Treponema sp.]|nr:PrsW family intramembrane metalloprotease [Candidatus Treponema equifaecale]